MIRETLEACRTMAQECAKIAQLVEIAEGSIPMGPNTTIAVTLRDTPRGGNDPTAAAIARVDGLEEWYLRDHAELVMLVEQVEDIIGGLETWEKVIIRAYYIDGKTDSEVASLIQCSRNRACEIRNGIIDQTLEHPCVDTHTAL